MNRAERRATWRHRDPAVAPASAAPSAGVNGTLGAIYVRIDEIRLDGLVSITRRDRDTIGEAIGKELGRLLRAGGPPEAWQGAGGIERLTAPSPIHLAANMRPAAIGRQVAGAVIGATAAPTGKRS